MFVIVDLNPEKRVCDGAHISATAGRKCCPACGRLLEKPPDWTLTDDLEIERPAILFDLDGTLVDTVYHHVTAWAAALRNAGILVPEWKIHRRIGMSGSSLVRQLVREHGLRSSKIDVELLEKTHDTVFNKSISSIQPLPGAASATR